jgi:hypothetical protein
VLELLGGVTVVPLTVVPGVVVSEVVVPWVVVSLVVVPGVVVSEVVVSVVVVPGVVVVSVVVVPGVVVVSVVVVPGVVVVSVVVVPGVVVVVEPAVQCEIVRPGDGTSPESSQVHVTTAFVSAAEVPGPGTSGMVLKLLPTLVIGKGPCPFTVIDTLLMWSASVPRPWRIHRVVPSHGTKPAPLTWFQVVVCVLANAAVGKTAHANIRTVAADTMIKPAIVRLRLCFALCSGIYEPPYLESHNRVSLGRRSYGTSRATPSGEGP